MDEYQEEFTRRNYLAAVEAIATEAARADDPAEYAHEAVEGSRWTFIHYGAQKVLQFSQNRDAAFNEHGAGLFVDVKSCVELFPRLAFWAMLHDIIDAMPEPSQEAEAEA